MKYNFPMQRSHLIRMYPNKEQEVRLRKTAGTSRYAYNWALATWRRMYEEYEQGLSTEKPSAFGLCNIWTREKPEWADETSRDAQNKAIVHVGEAFRNLWRGKAKYPTFHKKGGRDAFYVPNNKAWIKGKLISLPKIGQVRLSEELRYTGKVMSYTVSHYADQWHVSVQVEMPDMARICQKPDSVVGVDVGLSHAAVSSDTSIFLDLPKSLKRHERHLKDIQRQIARRVKGSNRRRKALLRKQRIQNKINNIRKDATHKFTSQLTKSHGVVVTESLSIETMKEQGTKSLRSALAWSVMSEVIRQISYKAHKHIKVDRFYPSSKRCSSCGFVKDILDLSERTYHCEHCGLTLDRDYNAALNLMQAGVVNPSVPADSQSTL